MNPILNTASKVYKRMGKAALSHVLSKLSAIDKDKMGWNANEIASGAPVLEPLAVCSDAGPLPPGASALGKSDPPVLSRTDPGVVAAGAAA